ncbi:MAG: hypothetical protein JST67_02030 [Bacteroidetes bacterium]|nr:hypothetical protein [Bacteroidota bacterium]
MKRKHHASLSILGITSLLFFLCSCQKKENTSSQVLPGVVSFSQDIVPIFNASCLASGCHAGGSPAANLNLTSGMAYTQLFSKHEIDTINANNSVLYIEVQSGSMPKNGAMLSNYQIGLIQKWIQQKAKNN